MASELFMSLYSEVKGKVPASLEEEFKKQSLAQKLPMGKLLAIAIDNELDQVKPFNYPIELPDDEYIPAKYTSQAVKIMDYLKKNNGGIGMDSLVYRAAHLF